MREENRLAQKKQSKVNNNMLYVSYIYVHILTISTLASLSWFSDWDFIYKTFTRANKMEKEIFSQTDCSSLIIFDNLGSKQH